MEHGAGKPLTELIVEARSLLSHDSSSSVETHEVHKPAGLGRQQDQLCRTALRGHPDAQLASMGSGVATFYSRTQMIIAYYGDSGAAIAADRFQRDSAAEALPF